MAADSSAGRRLVLVRHGQTAWNAAGRAQGHTDISLDDTGRQQAEEMAAVVADLRPALLVSSDLARARETAAFLEKATGLTAEEDARLREYDVGMRTGLTREEFAERLGDDASLAFDTHAHVEAPGAETVDAGRGADRARHPGGRRAAGAGGDRRAGDARRRAPDRPGRAARLAAGDRRHPRGDGQLRLGGGGRARLGRLRLSSYNTRAG